MGEKFDMFSSCRCIFSHKKKFWIEIFKFYTHSVEISITKFFPRTFSYILLNTLTDLGSVSYSLAKIDLLR